MSTAEKKRPLFEASVESRLIAERLSKAAIGEVVSYAELSELIGGDVRSQRNKSRCDTAMRNVLNEHRMVFGAVRNEGFQRLADSELAKVGEQYIGRMKRTAKRAKKKMACVDFSKLTAEQSVAWNVTATVISVSEEVMGNRSVKAIGHAVSEAKQQLPTLKAIEAAFSGNGK